MENKELNNLLKKIDEIKKQSKKNEKLIDDVEKLLKDDEQ